MNEQELPPDLTYEDAFRELQQLLNSLQEDNIKVDELTVRLAKAGKLIHFCRERLRMTEEQVAKLNEKTSF